MPHYTSWLGSQLQGAQLRMHRSIFFSFAFIDLKTSYTASYLFHPQLCRLGYAVFALKYVETARLLYLFFTFLFSLESVMIDDVKGAVNGVKLRCQTFKQTPMYDEDNLHDYYIHCDPRWISSSHTAYTPFFSASTQRLTNLKSLA